MTTQRHAAWLTQQPEARPCAGCWKVGCEAQGLKASKGVDPGAWVCTSPAPWQPQESILILVFQLPNPNGGKTTVSVLRGYHKDIAPTRDRKRLLVQSSF